MEMSCAEKNMFVLKVQNDKVRPRFGKIGSW